MAEHNGEGVAPSMDNNEKALQAARENDQRKELENQAEFVATSLYLKGFEEKGVKHGYKRRKTGSGEIFELTVNSEPAGKFLVGRGATEVEVSFYEPGQDSPYKVVPSSGNATEAVNKFLESLTGSNEPVAAEPAAVGEKPKDNLMDIYSTLRLALKNKEDKLILSELLYALTGIKDSDYEKQEKQGLAVPNYKPDSEQLILRLNKIFSAKKRNSGAKQEHLQKLILAAEEYVKRAG